MARFKLRTPFQPTGDQPEAIRKLVASLRAGNRHQTLLGVTGSGKTFTMAQVIAELGRPTLILAPNKTLAAQLYGEMRRFFPENAVGYFVSYYDYYQPEAYLPATDTYIEKDAALNEQIEQMRLAATKALLERRDVVIVASVSAIYGLGEPEDYRRMVLQLGRGGRIEREALLQALVELQYERHPMELRRGGFRVRGETVELFPVEEERGAVRIELFDDEISRLLLFDPLTGRRLQELERYTLYPKSHFATPRARLERAIRSIEQELEARLRELRSQGKLLEAERLERRTRYDLELLEAFGHCPGIENYSRHLSGRRPGEPPPTLLDYFPKEALLLIDESHVTIPQLQAMFRSDRSRKETLVQYGFRLPSALDNRPLTFEEFEAKAPQTVYVSATPGPYELERSWVVVEQLIRPTGLVDPEIEVRPASTQVEDLLSEIRERAARDERVLVTVLTKRMAENLTRFLEEHGVRVRYLHSEIDTIERVEILRDLREGKLDVLVGINLLREGLDLPEVSLVAILDADCEGFLRSTTALIQTIGRAARHIRGKAILYADRVTDAMRQAMEETERRRKKQIAYNREHGIEPKPVRREVSEVLEGGVAEPKAPYRAVPTDPRQIAREIERLEKEMFRLAEGLQFERAAELRDRIALLKKALLEGPQVG